MSQNKQRKVTKPDKEDMDELDGLDNIETGSTDDLDSLPDVDDLLDGMNLDETEDDGSTEVSGEAPLALKELATHSARFEVGTKNFVKFLKYTASEGKSLQHNTNETMIKTLILNVGESSLNVCGLDISKNLIVMGDMNDITNEALVDVAIPMRIDDLLKAIDLGDFEQRDGKIVVLFSDGKYIINDDLSDVTCPMPNELKNDFEERFKARIKQDKLPAGTKYATLDKNGNWVKFNGKFTSDTSFEVDTAHIRRIINSAAKLHSASVTIEVDPANEGISIQVQGGDKKWDVNRKVKVKAFNSSASKPFKRTYGAGFGNAFGGITGYAKLYLDSKCVGTDDNLIVVESEPGTKDFGINMVYFISHVKAR